MTMLGKKHTQETIEKMRKAKMGKTLSEETIEKIRQTRLGTKHSEKTIEKMRQAKLGKKLSPQAIEKARQARIGMKLSQETKDKIRQAHLGKKCSKETIEKMSVYMMGRYVGEKHPRAKRTIVEIGGEVLVTSTRTEMYRVLESRYGIPSPIHLWNRNRNIPQYLQGKLTYIQTGDTVFYNGER